MRRLLAALAIVVVLLSATRIAVLQADGYDGQEWKFSSPSPGYAEFEDTDAATYPDANAQMVTFVAPTHLPNSPLATQVLNNVQTNDTNNGSFYLLQTGLTFQSGAGSVTWTDTTHNYVAQPYQNPLIPYVGSHSYQFSISYTSPYWYMCAWDVAASYTYQCKSESNAPGTTLKAGNDTAVWFENHSKTANWWYGFDAVQANGAQIFRNGVGQDWATQDRHTMDACSTTWPMQNAFSGSLVAGGSGYFGLSGVPWACPVVTYNLPDVRNSGSWTSSVVVRNSTSSLGSATVTYYDAGGNPVLTHGDVSISAHGILNDTPPGNFTGSAQVGAPQDVAVVARHYATNNVDADNTFGLPGTGDAAFEQSRTTQYSAAFYSNIYSWNSTLRLQNTGTTSTNVTVYFKGRSGSDASWSTTLPALGTADLTGSAVWGSNPWVGSLVITASGPVAARVDDGNMVNGTSRTYNTAAYGSTMVYLPAAYKANYNLTTSIVAQNYGGATTDIGLYFFNRDGSYVTSYTLPSVGPQRAAGIGLASIGGIPSNWAGSVRIRSASGQLQPLVVIASNDSTTGASGAYNAASLPSAQVIFTHAARNANGSTSSYLAQNTSSASCSATAYYYDMNGNQVMTLPYNLAGDGSLGHNLGPDSVLGDNWTGSIILKGSCTSLVGVEREDTATSMSADNGVVR